MMDIAVNARVFCAGGHECGHTTYVVLNPVTQNVTHVVVKRTIWPEDERLVPIELVTESTQDHITLSCSRERLAEMDSFVETEFIKQESTHLAADPYVLNWPFQYTEVDRIPIKHERIPVGEMAVHRGARVHATDGDAGHIDGFLVDGTSEHITHLVLREGHLWGQKKVIVPVSDIAEIDEEVVYLKLDKKSLEELATEPTP
jgi:uncharacterized protein YrrD